MRRKDGLIDGIEEVKGNLKKKQGVVGRLRQKEAALDKDIARAKAELQAKRADVEEHTRWENELVVRAIHARMELECELQEHRRLQQAVSRGRVACGETERHIVRQTAVLSTSGHRARYNKEQIADAAEKLAKLRNAIRSERAGLASASESLKAKEGKLADATEQVESMTSALQVSVGEMTSALQRVKAANSAPAAHPSTSTSTTPRTATPRGKASRHGAKHTRPPR